MANYPYSSSPPPPSPPACNHTTSPTLPSPSPAPPPSPSCACNKTTTTPPPPSPSPPPPSSYLSPPLASLSPPPPPPPPTRYSPPVQSPPKPSRKQASPPPQLQPTPPPPHSSSPHYFPQAPRSSPLSPNPPPCHCVCPAPWGAPPPASYYNLLAPAPAPHLMSPSNGQRTVILTTFVSLGGVFFLAFIVIGLLATAMKKRLPSAPGSHVQTQPDSTTQGDVHNFESIPAGTSTEYSVIDMGNPASLDPKPVENLKVNQGVADLADQGAQPSHRTSQPNVTEKMSSDTEFGGDPSGGEGSVSNMDAPQGADEGKLDKSESRLLDHQDQSSVTDNADTCPNEEESSQQVGEDDSKDSRKKLRVPKKKKKKSASSGVKKGNEKRPGLGRQAVDAASMFEEQESQDDDDDDDKALSAGDLNKSDENEEQPTQDDQEAEKPQIDQTGANDKGSVQNAEDGSVENESTDSKQKPRLRNNNNSPGRVAKNRKKKRSGVSGVYQAVNVAGSLGLDEALQSQDGDDDEEEVITESEAQGDGEEFIKGTDQHVEQVGADEEDAKESDDKLLTDKDFSNEPKQKLSLPMSSGRVAKNKNKKSSRVRQGVNAAHNFGRDEALQSQDGDDDEDQVISESKAQGDGEEEVIGGTDQHVEQVGADENIEETAVDEQDVEEERGDKPQAHQTETDLEDSVQTVEKKVLVGEKSNDSKQKFRLPLKGKPLSRAAKKEDQKRCRVPQGVKVAHIFGLNDALQSQDGNDDEEQLLSESEARGDGEEFIAGTDQHVEQVGADEEEDAKERDDKRLADTDFSSPNLEERSVGLESNDPKQKSRLPKSSGRVVKQGDEKRSRAGQGLVTAARTFGSGEEQKSQDVDNDEEQSIVEDNDDDLIAGADENIEEIVEDEQDVAEERGNKPQTFQMETDFEDSVQTVEKTSVRERSQKSKQRFRLPRKEKSLSRVAKKEDQKSSKVYQECSDVALGLDEAQQSQDGDDNEEQVSELQAQEDEQELIGGQTIADEDDKIQVEESEFLLDSEELSSCPSRNIMASLDYLEGKIKVSEPVSSTQPSKQAMDVGSDDYKDGKAKVDELKSGGRNKDLQGRQHHTRSRQVKKPSNLAKIETATLGNAMAIFDNEDDRLQESEETEPSASNVDSYLGQLQTITALGIEESPNIVQNLSSIIDDDPSEELKHLGDGDHRVKKSQVHKLNKDSSRRIKGHQIISSPRTSDPNAELEICEDDKELDSEYPPGELEAWTDDVFATGDDDPDLLQLRNNECDKESAELDKDAPRGKPLSHSGTTHIRGRRRS